MLDELRCQLLLAIESDTGLRQRCGCYALTCELTSAEAAVIDGVRAAGGTAFL